jgi:hypothetical protein
MPSPPGTRHFLIKVLITAARIMYWRYICWASTVVAQLYMGLEEYAIELRDRNVGIAPKSPGSVFDLYGSFWLLTLWAYERFPPSSYIIKRRGDEK